MEKPIPPGELAMMKRWVDTWKYVTGPELRRTKTRELRPMSEDGMTRVMNARIRPAHERTRSRTSSGLVEQQRIFAEASVGR